MVRDDGTCGRNQNHYQQSTLIFTSTYFIALLSALFLFVPRIFYNVGSKNARILKAKNKSNNIRMRMQIMY